MKRFRLSPGPAAIAGCVVTLAAIKWFSSPWLVCPGIAFATMLLLGSDLIQERLQKWIDANPIRIIAAPAGLWLLYVIYATGMGIVTIRGALTMAVYLSVPFLVLGLRPKAEPLVILWLWLPMELGAIRPILIVRAPGGDVHYAFAQLLAIDVGILAFAVWNRTKGIGYRFEYGRDLVRNGLVNFCRFAVIAIPLGFAIGFIRYSFALRKLYVAGPVFAGIFLFTALPEEFLFRGLIQNWVERVSKRPGLSLVVASIIFGASHLNNGPPIPNYRYFLMASIAGLFYGLAWRKTGSVMASSLTHALVDTVWSVAFR